MAVTLDFGMFMEIFLVVIFRDIVVRRRHCDRTGLFRFCSCGCTRYVKTSPSLA